MMLGPPKTTGLSQVCSPSFLGRQKKSLIDLINFENSCNVYKTGLRFAPVIIDYKTMCKRKLNEIIYGHYGMKFSNSTLQIVQWVKKGKETTYADAGQKFRTWVRTYMWKLETKPNCTSGKFYWEDKDKLWNNPQRNSSITGNQEQLCWRIRVDRSGIRMKGEAGNPKDVDYVAVREDQQIADCSRL
jgi:hypothetical protein